MKSSYFISWLTGILTLALALFSFVLSFNALTDLAAKHGVSIPWLFPFLVEFGVVIFSLNALYRSLNGERAAWQWLLIIGSSLIAGTFNVLHADPDPVSKSMAAMPSLFLLLSFETFLGQVKHAVKRGAIVQSLTELDNQLNTKRKEIDTQLDKMKATLRQRFTQAREKCQAEIEQLDRVVKSKRQEVDTLNKEIKQLRLTLDHLKAPKSVQDSSTLHAREAKAEQDSQERDNRLTMLLDILRVNPAESVSRLAEQLDVSRTTIYNDLSTLQSQGVISKNGSGWKVSK